MVDVLTADEIRRAEAEVITGGVDELFLRLNAAHAVSEGLRTRALDKGAVTAVFCGTGGNGYDGLLAACFLKRLGANVVAYTVGDVERFDKKGIAYAQNEGLTVLPCGEYDGGADIIVDAIFGIGLSRDITGGAMELINKLNGSHAFKLAVDIPSGLNADSGEVMGVCFRADVTITFSCYKRGMLFGEGREYCGKVVVENVGVKTDSNIKVCDDRDFAPYKRKKSAHKGTCGRVFIIGGCGTMIGAPLMAGAAAHAAYLNGAGTVTVCLPSVHRAAAASRASMAMMKFLPDTPDGFIKLDRKALDGVLSKAVAVDIGMGMGNNPYLKDIVGYVCENFSGALVLDADALNAIRLDYAFLSSSKAKIALTPHVGEFERLTGKPATIENAVSLARETGAVVVLKSATTIITDGNTVRLNASGTPAMAKGGMGDVLGGCITALSCVYSMFDAATIACYRNGIGAERAVSSYSETMLTAHDVLKFADYDEL